MKGKKTNYRSESIFSANRNLFEVLETIDDEKEAKRSANFFNNNKNILLNLFVNQNSHNHVNSILLDKKNHLNHGRKTNKKECKKVVDKNDGGGSKEDDKSVRNNRPVCANKKWIEHFCWFCSLNLLDEVLEKEIYKEKIHPHVYDLIYDENTYFDTSSMMSVPYEFARFMLTQLDNNIVRDIKINNIIKEEKYLFKKFCKKYRYNKEYGEVGGGSYSGGRPCSSSGYSGSSGSSDSNGSSGSRGSVKSDHSLDYRSRTFSPRYSNYLNIRRELFNSSRGGPNGLDHDNRVNRVRRRKKLFYDTNNLGNCDSTDLSHCTKVSLTEEVRKNNNSNLSDTLPLGSEGERRKEAGEHSRLTSVGDASDRKGSEQISPSVSNSSTSRGALRGKKGSQKKEASDSYMSSHIVWKNKMGRSGRRRQHEHSYHSGSSCIVGRVAPGEKKGNKGKRLTTNRRELRRCCFAKRSVCNNVYVKYDALCDRLVRRNNSFRIHRVEEGGTASEVSNEGGVPQETRKDRRSSRNSRNMRNMRSHRIYNKYKNNLNYIKQFYYIDETKKKPFPLCLYNIIKSYGTIKQCSRCYCFFNSMCCHCLECKRKSNMSLKNPHYFIFQHGLTASVHDFQNIVNPLLTKYPHLFIYITYSNQSHTFEGVDVGTERICTELNCLFKVINDKINVSMIGHSLGGILNRSVLINLYRKKMFKNKKLINFITFACPHIGVHENMAIMKLLSTYLGAHTIDDLNNKTTVLLKIASVESISILKKFENIIFYGNSQSDWLVGIRTSLILPYTLFNEELIMFIIEQAKNVPEIPINIFSVVHLYMRKKKLLFFYFYQDLKNPNYLLNKRKDQNRFLDQMLQTIISSRKLLSCSQREKFNVFMNYYGEAVAKEDGKKGKVKKKKKSFLPYEDSFSCDNVHGGEVNNSSTSRNGSSKREDSRACEEQTCSNAPVQVNRRGGSIQQDDKAPILHSTRDKPYMSDGVNVQMLPIHFRKNVSTGETNRTALKGVCHSSDKVSPMNILSVGTKEGGSPPQKEKRASLYKSHSYEDIQMEGNKRGEATSDVVSGTNASGNTNTNMNSDSAEKKTNKMSYYNKYLCIPDNYKIVSNATVTESGGAMYSNVKINNVENCYVEGVCAGGGKSIQDNRHTSDRSKSCGPAKGNSTPIGATPHNANQSNSQENNNKKKFGDYKYFQKLFFECLKRKIINDIKTLDNNLKKKKMKEEEQVVPRKSFSLQNTINALKNYSLFYLKNGSEGNSLEGGAAGLQNGRQNYQPVAESSLTVAPDQGSTVGEGSEAVQNMNSESCGVKMTEQLNVPHSNESNKEKENNMLQVFETKNEEYDYISEFFYTTSDDSEEGDENDESFGDEHVVGSWTKSDTHNEQVHGQPHEQPQERSDNAQKNAPTTSGVKKKWKRTTLLKGITKNDKQKYKQILFHIYTISNEQLIEKFCKNPELLYYEVLFYCLNQVPIQRYAISLPVYSNAHVQIIAHPRICSEESATVKHFLEHLIL
ncbi:hypothetical protein AK88_04241 [Plasmodium fragile]|uniref:DUF676 domain-containing protein n=1 Tax=Plasmodium fragile TaxID=5857 RepID=A0A0D9QGN6_PLAFR|nr:uncharacterized protein AK88_04241 [Plasmodium fragile]KJP86118.1 hypothetical protein AK88_04241 [Plasmodium fragile]